MAEDAIESTLPSTDNDIKLQHLIDSVLKQQRDETNRLLSHWEELKMDESKRLAVSSFSIRGIVNRRRRVQTNRLIETFFVLSVTSDSPRDLAMWKACLLTAAANNKHPLVAREDLELSAAGISLRNLKYGEVHNILHCIDGLIKRTDFGSQEFDPAIRYPSLKEKKAPLSQLIDSVIQLQKDTKKELLRYCEELKSSKCRITFHFQISGMHAGAQTSVVKIYWYCQYELLFWKACVIYAFFSLQADEISYEQVGNYFDLTMKTDNMGRVLQLLKPIAGRMVTSVTFEDEPSGIISHLCDFFESASVERLQLHPVNQDIVENFDLWLEFVRRVQVPVVDYKRRLEHSNDIQEFLIPISHLVEELRIEEDDTEISHKPIPASVFPQIFSGKCKRIIFRGESTSTFLKEAEDLVTLFHRLKKKCVLEMQTDMEPMNVQIGEYKVEVEGGLGELGYLIIVHIDDNYTKILIH